jgi:glucose-6-phosphate isomerase
MPGPVALPARQTLQEHRGEMEGVHVRDLFAADPQRFEKFSQRSGDILFDYSRNRLTQETMRLLCDLARLR